MVSNERARGNAGTATGWREVSRRSRYDKDRLLRDDDPGPHMTAIQLEWAAREIEELRRAR